MPGIPAIPGGVDALLLARMVFNSTLTDRASLGRMHGKSFQDSSGNYKRELYEALGYPESLTFSDYMSRYTRQDIAARVIKAPVEGAWQVLPQIVDDEDPKKETKFEADLRGLDERLSLFEMLERVDLLSGIGRFGVLVLGYDDTGNDLSKWSTPVSGTPSLEYLLPFSEESITISSLDDGKRFNLPKIYQISQQTTNDISIGGKVPPGRDIHWSRVIHVAEGLLEDEVYGEPRLRDVWNRMEDIERISGGSAEMFWRGAFPGMGFELDKDFSWDNSVTDSDGNTPKEAQKAEIENYIHGLKRYFRMQGIKAQQFAPQAVSPLNHLDVQIQLVSAAKKMPKRILTGSERGELASSQDEDAWIRELDRRREKHVGPKIIRKTINRLLEHKVLSEPKDGTYAISWPSLLKTNEKDQAEIAAKKAEAIQKYVSAPGAESVLPVPLFLKIVLGLNDDQIEAVTKINRGLIDRERSEIEGDTDDV